MAYNANTRTFDLLSDLVSQVGIDRTVVAVAGGTSFNDGNGGWYFWDSTSTATHDGSKVIQVTGVTTGRWIRSKNNNYGNEQAIFSGVALTTTYTITHNLTYQPAFIGLTPRTPNAGSAFLSGFYATNINSITFQIVFTGIPIIGTNNLIFDFFGLRGNT